MIFDRDSASCALFATDLHRPLGDWVPQRLSVNTVRLPLAMFLIGQRTGGAPEKKEKDKKK